MVAMLEGMSVRAISRFTGLHKHTILSLMLTAAEKARQVLNAKVQNISPRFVQLDEMWEFVHTKEHNLGFDDPEEWGSFYLWLGMDSETKLMISHHIGARNGFERIPVYLRPAGAHRWPLPDHERPIQALLGSDPRMVWNGRGLRTASQGLRQDQFRGLVRLGPGFGGCPTCQNWEPGRR
jgi:lambda repressor-like predicted transcriptional regulator